MIIYTPFEQRTPDSQYSSLLSNILHHGELIAETQLDESALKIIGAQFRFDLRNGFPIITERDLVSGKNSIFHQSLGELFAFLNGATTQKELVEFGCNWWRSWVTEKKCKKRGLEIGELGPGSYGAAFRNFPTSSGGSFDQITHIIEQLIELPQLRSHFVSPWIPQYCGRGQNKTQKVVVVPCHGWMHFQTNTKTKELSLHHFQRSGDVPVGIACNLIQYAALTLMVAQVIGYTAKDLIYTISDAHIYMGQEEAVKKLLTTNPQKFPTVKIDPEIKNIFDFRQEHFIVEDYYPQLERMKIWTPI